MGVLLVVEVVIGVLMVGMIVVVLVGVVEVMDMMGMMVKMKAIKILFKMQSKLHILRVSLCTEIQLCNYLYPLGPLYAGAAVTRKESCLVINQYAVAHHLTESCIMQLLDLVELHCSPQNCCPRTIHKLRKDLDVTQGIDHYQYCSVCLEEIPMAEKKCCRQQCKGSTVCNFVILPFEDHLLQLCEGIYVISI